MIRIALLDDHPAVLIGLQRLLQPARDMEVLAAAADEVALARALRGRKPDVLIVDYDPDRGDVLALCRRVKARPGTPRVLIYTAYAGPALTVAARTAGGRTGRQARAGQGADHGDPRDRGRREHHAHRQPR